jgi:hypothetical protein
MMVSEKYYPEPVHSLLTLGEADWQEWADYKALGFDQEHIPDLIHMATDPFLILEAEEPEFWAPVHAWRALAQLDARKAIDPLIGDFNLFEAADNDWLTEDLPRALIKLGPDCIPALAMYLIDTRHETFGRMVAGETLKNIAREYPGTLEQVKGTLISAMELFAENDEEVNGSILADLLDLNAVEALPVVRKAFAANAIDITIAGDLEDAEMEFGFREERSTPSRIKEVVDQRYPYLRVLSEKAEQEVEKQKQSAPKEKAKKKQRKKSRKQNRRK